jgi:hypothetical protein
MTVNVESIRELPRGPHPLYRVLQCYIAWPAGAKSRSRVLHRVLQSATQGATFCKVSSFDGPKQRRIDFGVQIRDKEFIYRKQKGASLRRASSVL